MRHSRLLPIFLVVFVDLLGFGLILPLLPFYAENYGASAVLIGLLTASYAAAQLIGAPILGRLSDRYGRRPILLISIGGTLLGYLLLGFADPLGRALVHLFSGASPSITLQSSVILGVMFASRIIDGLTGGNITVAQAYISDVTDQKDRAKGLGLVGAAFGLGFILGPAAGGLLSTWGFATPAFVAAGFATLNLVMIFINLPESLTSDMRIQLAGRERPAFTLAALIKALNRARVGPLIHIRFFYGMAFSMFQTIFPLYAQSHLALNALKTGLVLTYVGVLAALVQGLAVGRISRRFSDPQLILWGSAMMGFGLLAWAGVSNVWMMLVVMTPIALAGGVLNTILNSALTKAVYPEEIGGTLGLSTSVDSLTRVISPSLGGFLLGNLGSWAPGIFGTLMMAWVTSFAWRRIVKNPDPILPERNWASNLEPYSSNK
jgi:DHA1 family tetracycline resistance protein-like MFS transporter